METIARHTRHATIMEAREFARRTSCPDHSMVGGAMVGRRGCLQTQRGRLRLEQLGDMGMLNRFSKDRVAESTLIEC